jgi:hypothetical protein
MMMMNSTFKLGDRIKVVSKFERARIGLLGTACHILKRGDNNLPTIGVAHDNRLVSGHECEGHCQEGYGWYYKINEIEHLTIDNWQEEFE